MPKVLLLLSLFIVLNSSDCDTQKQAQRIAALEAEVKQLKADVVELKGKPKEHHYELRNEGLRTWRFDPTTGDTCLKLTSTEDWKRKETKAQSCECADNSAGWYEMPRDTDEQRNTAQYYYDTEVKPSCGQ